MEKVFIELEYIGIKKNLINYNDKLKNKLKEFWKTPTGHSKKKGSLDEKIEICIFISSPADPGRN